MYKAAIKYLTALALAVMTAVPAPLAASTSESREEVFFEDFTGDSLKEHQIGRAHV